MRELSIEQQAATLYNLALMHNSRGAKQRAGFLLYRAYQLNKHDDHITTRLARWLSQNGQPEVADRVLRKHEVDVTFELPFTEPALPENSEAVALLTDQFDGDRSVTILPEFFAN